MKDVCLNAPRYIPDQYPKIKVQASEEHQKICLQITAINKSILLTLSRREPDLKGPVLGSSSGSAPSALHFLAARPIETH